MDLEDHRLCGLDEAPGVSGVRMTSSSLPRRWGRGVAVERRACTLRGMLGLAVVAVGTVVLAVASGGAVSLPRTGCDYAWVNMPKSCRQSSRGVRMQGVLQTLAPALHEKLTMVPTPEPDPASGLPPMKDRVYLITGARTGIGKHTANKLIGLGATVLMTGRREKGIKKQAEDMVRAWEKRGVEPNVYAYAADLSSMAQVRKLGEEIDEEHPVIHAVLHNAASVDGDRTGQRKLNDRGIEITLAVNVMAPFLLTSLLLPNVRASGCGRFLLSGSTTMEEPELLHDLESTLHYTGNRAYRLSKLCGAMLQQEMHERFGNAPKLAFHTVDPGIADTFLMRHMASWGRGKRFKRAENRHQTIGEFPNPRTALNSFKALTEDRYSLTSGTWDVACTDDAKATIRNAELRRKLWDDITELTEAQYPSREVLEAACEAAGV